MRTDELTAGRFRVYPPDAIPLWALSSKRAVTHIGKTFGFEQFQFASVEGEKEPPALVFGRGRHPATPADSPATIETLRVSSDRLDLTIRSDDGHPLGDAVLAEFERVCTEVTQRGQPWLAEFRVEAVLTAWVGQLDLSPEDLVDPRATAVLLPGLSGAGNGSRQVRGRGLALKVWAPPRADLLELGLQPTDDEFRLEPRAGRLAGERVWFSTSPLRSEEHLSLLERLEAAYRR